MRLLSIVGARPQFMKVAVIASALKAVPASAEIEHRILHTGQHYDPRMSDCFFRQLDIPEPDFHLGIGSGAHGAQTGAMLAGIERILSEWRADAVVVYGDTNSTVAGALAAAKMHVGVIHVEAGLRSFNRRMPEEINRIATDHLSDVLLCPTVTAMENARREGLGNKSWMTGDVMLDLLLKYAAGLDAHPLATDNYALVTMHRAENTDSPVRMDQFITLLERLPLTAILPMHPRVRAKLPASDLARIERLSHVRVLEPCDYGEMLALERDARVVLTDSGGVQKEAYFLGVPCLTLRTETEWKETLAGGWNRVVDMNPDAVLPMVDSLLRGNGFLPKGAPDLEQFGSGRAGEASVNRILKSLRGES